MRTGSGRPEAHAGIDATERREEKSRVDETTHRRRRIAWIACVALGVLAFAAIYIFTVQTPVETSGLSGSVERKLTPTGLAAGATPWDVAKELVRQASAALFSVASVRKWAHTGEFFVLALFVCLAVLLWVPRAYRRAVARPQRLRRRLAVALALCAACSLFDQTHKLFVPGREFDALDLLFDAFGYLLAIALVFGAAARRRRVRP